MTLNGTNYLSVEGTTEVVFLNDVYRTIAGKYSGMLADAFGDTITISDGRFSLPTDEQ